MLETKPASDGSAYREYVLTERGRGLFLVIVALRQWGEDHLYRPGEPHSTLVGTRGQAIAHLDLRSVDGRALGWNDTRVQKADEEPPRFNRKVLRRAKEKGKG